MLDSFNQHWHFQAQCQFAVRRGWCSWSWLKNRDMCVWPNNNFADFKVFSHWIEKFYAFLINEMQCCFKNSWRRLVWNKQLQMHRFSWFIFGVEMFLLKGTWNSLLHSTASTLLQSPVEFQRSDWSPDLFIVFIIVYFFLFYIFLALFLSMSDVCFKKSAMIHL